MTIEEISAMVRDLGVRIRYVEMPPDRDGEYHHDLRLIRIQSRLTERAHRSVLAHECAHAAFGDVPSMFGPANARQERRADEWAALRLITIDDYRRAESLHQGHPEAMAVELDVLVDIIDAFQRVLLRVGDNVYITPRMGSGQYAQRVEAG
jgi:hypothetical protein